MSVRTGAVYSNDALLYDVHTSTIQYVLKYTFRKTELALVFVQIAIQKYSAGKRIK